MKKWQCIVCGFEYDEAEGAYILRQDEHRYLVRALTAGNTLEEGLYSAAQESDEPIRGVFLSVSRQVRLGASGEETLAEAKALKL